MKYATIIACWNEPIDQVTKAIDSIKAQETPCSKIILVDDGSQSEFGKEYKKIPGIDIVTLPFHKESHLFTSHMSAINNHGLKNVPNDYNVLLMSSDTILPEEYVLKLTCWMSEYDISIAGGIYGNNSHLLPMEAGSFITSKAMGILNHSFLSICHSEYYAIATILGSGNAVGVYNKLNIQSLRDIGTNYSRKMLYYRGMALRQYGFNPSYSLYRSIRLSKKYWFEVMSGYFNAKPMNIGIGSKWIKYIQKAEMMKKLGRRIEAYDNRIDGIITRIPT